MEKFKNPTTYLITIGTIICLSFIAYYHYKPSALKIPLKEIDKHLVYQEEKKFDCVEEYEQLLTSNPNSYEANYLLANLLYVNKSVKDSAKIENLLLKSWKLNNRFWQTCFMLAKIYYSKNNLNKASEYNLKAFSLNKSYQPIKDLNKEIVESLKYEGVELQITHLYTIDMVDSVDLVSYYYYKDFDIKAILEDIDFLSKRKTNIKYNGQNYITVHEE